MTLVNACLDSKLKYGCQFWDSLRKKQVVEINKVKVNLLKNIMEIPTSTPDSAIQHDFGLVDMSLEVKAEKVIVAVEVMKSEDERIDKKLLRKLLDKEIPGFRMQVVEIVEEYKLGSIEALCKVKDIRTVMRKVIIDNRRAEATVVG